MASWLAYWENNLGQSLAGTGHRRRILSDIDKP